MSAELEEVEDFYQQGAALAVKMASGGAGALIGALIAGPPGAVLGSLVSPFLEHQFNRAVGEIITRQFGERQRMRAAVGTVLLATNIENFIQRGQVLRSDNFDQQDATGRRPFDELTEQAVLDMMNSVEERRLPFLANLYASLYFDSGIPRASIATFVSIANSLNFRAMCAVSIVGQKLIYTGKERVDGQPGPWPDLDHMVATEVFNLITTSVLVNKAEDVAHYATTLSSTDVEPGTLQLGPIGQIIYEKMGLFAINADVSDLIETQESLQRIASCPSGEPNFGEQFEAALKPYERRFDLVDWAISGTEFVISIPTTEHRNDGIPVVQVERFVDGGGFEHVGVDIRTCPDGTVEVLAARPFSGRLIIA